MKSLIKSLTLCAVVGAGINLNAQTVTVDPATLFNGYMNVFNTTGAPGLGAAAASGGTVGGTGGWGVADLRSSFSGSTVTLQANTIGDPNPYWYVGGGGPGAIGNKIMDANLYNDSPNSSPSTTLTFTGNVLLNNLAGQVNGIGEGWTAVAFIKDFAPDYSSFTQTTAALTPGIFSISQTTSANAGDHIQYGFEVIGPDVWAGDPLTANSIVVAPVPEPSSLAVLGLGALAMLRIRRSRAA